MSVKYVNWSNSLGESGIAYMTPQFGGSNVTWQSRGNIQLFIGENLITVTATGEDGSTTFDSLTATYEKTLPTITITSPTSNPNYLTGSETIDISGHASDSCGIESVVWKNEATATSGIANGTNCWNITGVALMPGMNLIYVNATDKAGNKGYDAIWVNLDPTLGSRITFSDAPTGTTGDFAGMALRGNSATDVVVIDQQLWIMFRSSDNKEIAEYHPSYLASSWNISFMAFTPSPGSAYIGMDPGKFGLRATIKNGADTVAGIELAAGNHSSEGIYALEGSTWEMVRQGISPAFPGGNGSNGEKPDRYVVSFEWKNGNITTVVRHTKLGMLFVQTTPTSYAYAAIHFASDSKVLPCGDFPYQRNITGGWMLDDLTVRAPKTAYPAFPLLWEEVPQDEPVKVSLTDERGMPMAIQMRIAGEAATRNGTCYEADYPREVDWCVDTTINIDSGPVLFKDSIYITTTSTTQGTQVAKWWGGWDWASVLGADDCRGYVTAANRYHGYDHPLTAYIEVFPNNPGDILSTQSEVAMHFPHDFISWKSMNWSEAASMADTAHSEMEAFYEYASRWDNPAYVGDGDAYTSYANPGDAASYQVMFAQYLRGTRIMGISSNYLDTVAGNSSLYGSWWLPNSQWWTTPGHSWQPSRPTDMLDAYRAWCTDSDYAPWELVKSIASQGGVLRAYNHHSINSKAATVLHWIVDPKTNFSFENWKATDGEVASYVYALHTTSVTRNMTAGPISYDVHRQDPKKAGYWLVPVTISIDLQGKNLSEVMVIEHRSTGDYFKILQPLNGKRTMDVGFDVRNGTLYVSDFFNESTTIVAFAYPLTVSITNPTSEQTILTNWNMTSLKGTASDDKKVVNVTWSNSLGGSGIAYMTPQFGGSNVTWQSRGNVMLYLGNNVITVTARNSNGGTATDILTINYVSPNLPPICNITYPTSNPTMTTGWHMINLKGTAVDNRKVVNVIWSNSLGGSGTMHMTPQFGGPNVTWQSRGNVMLYPGDNVITVTASDSDGNAATDTLTVSYLLPEIVPLVCEIKNPTSNQTMITNWHVVFLGGMASDDKKVIGVTWSNSLGGSDTMHMTPQFGGPNVTWQSRSNVMLYPGDNVITVTAFDSDGNNVIDILTVTYDSVSPICTITYPTSSSTYRTNSPTIDIAGSALDTSGIASVVWTNTANGASGALTCTDWSTSGVPLSPGLNTIYVNATDNAGNKGSDVILVTYVLDTITVKITEPTVESTMVTDWHMLSLRGTASSDTPVVYVYWERLDDHGGYDWGIAYLTPQWGDYSVTWQSRGNINLTHGNNYICVTAIDSEGSNFTTLLTVTYTGK